MPKHHLRMHFQEDGNLCIEDLSPLEMSILIKLGISFSNPSVDDDNTATPKYVSLKTIRIPTPMPSDLEELEALHNHVLNNQDEYRRDNIKKGGVSIFDLKKKMLAHYLKECNLCGFRCDGQKAADGYCPITQKPSYHQHFVHLGEEREIGKTLAIELIGCNMRCVFCQKGELISQTKGLPFTSSLWKEIRKEYGSRDFNNISFLGGNPDQSIAGIFDFLSHAPKWALSYPIIWHTNAYATRPLYNLLKGLVDLWVVDFKYFNDNCARKLSGVTHYTSIAQAALNEICDNLSSDAPVIVRHLILPGHWECCQKPLVQWLSGNKSKIIFHPLKQYRPLWKVNKSHGQLDSRITESEFQLVANAADKAGLVTTGLSTFT